METDNRRQKLDVVWASVFLTAFAMWGVFVLAASEASDLQLTAVGLALGLIFSLFTVPLLLLFSGSGRGLLLVGRILVCVQLLCLVAAVVLGIVVIASLS